MKILAYILGGILIFFGVLFLWASFGNVLLMPAGFLTGLITMVAGFGAVWFGARKKPSADGDQNVTLQIDLSGDVKLETLKCESCGGSLSPEHVTMVAGAPVVNCPYCKTSYQLTEEPKW